MKLEDHMSGSEPAHGPASRLLVVLDYDGTVTTRECNEMALQTLIGDAWRPFESEVRAGRMGHAEAFDSQIRLIRAPRQRFLDALVAAARPEPGLMEFLQDVAIAGGRAVVVSAGFREVIEAFWHREALPTVQIYASELVNDGPDGVGPYHIDFNPALGDCPRCGPAQCKGGLLRDLRRPSDYVVVFGDGDSDLCPAREADLTFARGWLAERCAAERLPWRPLDFNDARRVLAAYLRPRHADEEPG
jgi:2-hydroxy-3-keto-5-methylthiopentenyl-1-phosphate phosphatase